VRRGAGGHFRLEDRFGCEPEDARVGRVLEPREPDPPRQAIEMFRERKGLAVEDGDRFKEGIAQEHARAGRHAEALGWYDRALASDPAYCYAYFHKARSLEELDRADEACATLRTGIDAARRAGDSHALGEMRGYLDQLE
jgi:tetratricopeptide (TPR) repeat protein